MTCDKNGYGGLRKVLGIVGRVVFWSTLAVIAICLVGGVVLKMSENDIAPATLAAVIFWFVVSSHLNAKRLRRPRDREQDQPEST